MLPSGEASKATAMGLCLEEARDLPVKERSQGKGFESFGQASNESLHLYVRVPLPLQPHRSACADSLS
jgi:hypothetical protein